ncbi:sugar phosphate isomerase/epimerase [Paenibacillus sp. BSR1-1]|uniref:sugar phosphate isomerase/epimerase family protein n=1 Tax=Paenibacillus sp. BSR1-1 TaxID=3020845 RepID=UPI0025B26495|nr:sugar phosphate isomerase/epimerase [Paenibacillus sp. BSR1-1]MDN3015610.1 sugar phosphate isomerase/epimerase [Paenibacillus sp. BSR1-1]
MKLSIFTDMLGCESFEEALHHTKELGFENIDLRGKLNGSTIDNITLDKARYLSLLVKENNLKVSSLSSWAVNPCTFSGTPSYRNDDENHHKQMSTVLNRLFDLADIFSAQYIRIYSLYRQEDFNLLQEDEKEKQYKFNAEMMLRHAEHAKERGKILLVENEPPTLTSNCEELGILVKYTNHPNLKINWDIVNGWRAGEYPTLEKYECIKGAVYQTHLKGASRLSNSITKDNPFGLFGNFAIAGKDEFDHEPIMKALSEHDPQAILTIDTHYPSFYQQDKLGEVEVVRKTKEFFENILKKEGAYE